MRNILKQKVLPTPKPKAVLFMLEAAQRYAPSLTTELLGEGGCVTYTYVYIP